MGGPPGNDPLVVEYVLRLTKCRLRMVSLWAALLGGLALGLAELTAFILADHLSGGLSDSSRRLAQILMLALPAAGGLWWVVIPIFRRLSDLYVARLIEKAHPELRTDLTAALQLAQQPDVNPGVSRPSSARPPRSCPARDLRRRPRRRHSRLGRGAGAATVLFLAYAIVAPKSVLPSLARAFGSLCRPRPGRRSTRWPRPPAPGR